jgi:hypothetical protein
MCHEYYWRRRREEADESRRMWDEFARTEPPEGTPLRDDDPKPEPEKADEEIIAER